MVYLMLADGFEEIEALTVVDVLRRANIDIQTASIQKQEYMVTGAHGIPVHADVLLNECNIEETEAVILPGGMPGTTHLAESAELGQFLDMCVEKSTIMAAICAAPMVFGKRGFLMGKEATCYPGFEDHLKGATLSNRRVVQDGNFITSKGPGTALEFALFLVRVLKGESVSKEIAKGMIAE